MNERLTGVSVFVAVVETGSFAQAAQRLAVTRSAVAKVIAKLEQRLKVRLFNRTTRVQSLTDDGQSYYERCVRALAELEAAEESLENGRREPAGKLRLTAPVLLGRRYVAPVLLDLSRRYPSLKLEVSFNDRVMDLAEEGFDLAVRIGPVPNSSRLIARPLGMQRLVICAAPDYLDRKGRPTNLPELESHVGIVYVNENKAAPWRLRGEDGSIVYPQINSRLHFDDLQTIADAAIAGAGLAWLPYCLIAPALDSGRLELVMSVDQVMASEINAVWPRTTHLPLKVRATVDALAKELPKQLDYAANAAAV